jgi:hypothetical protein
LSAHARAWLAMRAGSVPPELEALMESAVDDVIGDETPVPHALAEAARMCLRRAMRNCDERAAALPLLAADALMTYACEAAAATDSAALEDLATTCTGERLARLVPR